jgi:hypothetical protein
VAPGSAAPARREPLIVRVRAVLHAARERISNPQDRADVERTAERLSGQLGVDLAPANPARPDGGA